MRWVLFGNHQRMGQLVSLGRRAGLLSRFLFGLRGCLIAHTLKDTCGAEITGQSECPTVVNCPILKYRYSFFTRATAI